VPLLACTPRTLQEAKRGLGASAVFIARNRFAVLDKAANSIQVGWVGLVVVVVGQAADCERSNNLPGALCLSLLDFN
jgi:hypothetical protein